MAPLLRLGRGGNGWLLTPWGSPSLCPHHRPKTLPRGGRSGPQTGQDPSHVQSSGTLAPRTASQTGPLEWGAGVGGSREKNQPAFPPGGWGGQGGKGPHGWASPQEATSLCRQERAIPNDEAERRPSAKQYQRGMSTPKAHTFECAVDSRKAIGERLLTRCSCVGPGPSAPPALYAVPGAHIPPGPCTGHPRCSHVRSKLWDHPLRVLWVGTHCVLGPGAQQ